MEWTSQDDIEGECAPTQLVPASQACDIAEESALEFNPDQSQDAWGAPESLDAWSAPSPVSPPRTAASPPPRAEGWSPAPKAPENFGDPSQIIKESLMFSRRRREENFGLKKTPPLVIWPEN